MDAANTTADEQKMLWNNVAGPAWVEMQVLLDQLFKPMEDRLVGGFAPGSDYRVLDVGCGTGATTLAVARLLGAKGCVVGIDISNPMVDAARARVEREGGAASFILANAETHTFEPASFDRIISRFGVMFFDDPIRAFSNLRRGAKDDAEIHLIAWRGAAENPFMTTAERAAASLLPNLPARQSDGPGQFAFGDEKRVRRILEESGWADLDIRPVDFACTLPAKDLDRYMTRLGPLGRVLQEADDQTRLQVIEKVRAAFEPYVHGAEVCFTAACWTIGAKAS